MAGVRCSMPAIASEVPASELENVVAAAAYNAMSVTDRNVFAYDPHIVKKDRYGNYKVTFFAKEEVKP